MDSKLTATRKQACRALKPVKTAGARVFLTHENELRTATAIKNIAHLQTVQALLYGEMVKRSRAFAGKILHDFSVSSL